MFIKKHHLYTASQKRVKMHVHLLLCFIYESAKYLASVGKVGHKLYKPSECSFFLNSFYFIFQLPFLWEIRINKTRMQRRFLFSCKMFRNRFSFQTGPLASLEFDDTAAVCVCAVIAAWKCSPLLFCSR